MKTFTAQLKQFTDKTARNLDLIVKDAAQTTLNSMAERQPGVGDTGGSFVIGKVPVDTGFLANTQIAMINGATVAQGMADYTGVIAGMELGDSITGAYTAFYAPYVEYGTSSMSGRFFVREAVVGWQGAVDAAVAKFGD